MLTLLLLVLLILVLAGGVAVHPLWLLLVVLLAWALLAPPWRRAP